MFDCPDWPRIREHFDQLPKPGRARGDEGEIWSNGWIFRGQKRESYLLEPTIEREWPHDDWNETEYKALQEFQSKARLHMDAAQLPKPDDKLGWLAIMQHYGAPTRLLDFTYSPYVALYFALRNRRQGESVFVEVWGMDATALRERATRTSREADEAVRTHQKTASPAKSGKVSLSRADAATLLQRTQEDDNYWESSIRQALTPCGARREYLNRHGFVAEALPINHNPRLSSQQGVFLFNGAEQTFEESLELMMSGVSTQWYKRFRVPESVLSQIEAELFQLNVHDLSLFPDTEGLAGFVKQKIRLHW